MKWMSLALLALVLAGALMSGCTAPSNEKVAFELSIKDAQGNVLLQKQTLVQKGTNGFEALQNLALVQTKPTAFGKMVIGLEGVQAESDQYWALYTNGEYSMVGIESVEINEATQMQWRLEAIQS